MWVLIFTFAISTTHAVPVTQEFTSEQACQKALGAFANRLNSTGQTYLAKQTVGVCVPK